MVVYPIDITGDWCECSVVFAIFHYEASDAMLFPCSIALPADQWATTVTTASIGQAGLAKTCADHVSPVEAFGVGCHWKHGLLKGVVGTAWVLD